MMQNAFRRAFSSSRSLEPANKRSLTDYLGIAVFLGAAGFTGYLGYWQTQRYSWKVGLVEERKRQLSDKALKVDASNVASIKDFHLYQKIMITGKFDLGNLYFVGPRSAPKEISAKQAMAPQGYYVIAPFISADSVLLTNVGWVPKSNFLNYLKEERFAEEKLTKETEIELITAAGEDSDIFSAGSVNPQYPRALLRFDVPLLREILGVHESVFTVMPEEGNEGVELFEEVGLRPSKRSVSSYTSFIVEPITHIGYSATWFGVCATCLAVLKLRFM